MHAMCLQAVILPTRLFGPPLLTLMLQCRSITILFSCLIESEGLWNESCSEYPWLYRNQGYALMLFRTIPGNDYPSYEHVEHFRSECRSAGCTCEYTLMSLCREDESPQSHSLELDGQHV
jgi:hypothetical protein